MHNNSIGKVIALLLFLVYIIMLLRLTVFRDDFLEYRLFTHGTLNLVPFDLYGKLLREHMYMFAVYQFGGNIAWFVSFGFLLPYMTGRPRRAGSVILLGFLLSFLIEVSQFAFGTGESELDDLILNTLGAALGFLLFRLLRNIKERNKF